MTSEECSAEDDAYYELMMQQGSFFDSQAVPAAAAVPLGVDDDAGGDEAWLSAMVASSEQGGSMVKDENDEAWKSLLQRRLEERELPATDAAACDAAAPPAHRCSRELEAEILLRWLDSAGASGALRNALAADRRKRRWTAGPDQNAIFEYWVNSWTEPSCAAGIRKVPAAPRATALSPECSILIFSTDIAATANVCMAALAPLVSDIARVRVTWSGRSEMPEAQRKAISLVLDSFGSQGLYARDLGAPAQEGRHASPPSAESTDAASTAALEIACGHLANAELTQLRAENAQLRRKLDLLCGVGRCVSGNAYNIPGNLVDVFGDTIDAVDHVRSYETVSARFVGVVDAYQHVVLRWGHPVLRTRTNGPYFVFVLHEGNAQGVEEPTPITNERMCSVMHWPMAPSAEDIPEYTGLVAGTSLGMDLAFRVHLRAADLRAVEPGDPSHPRAMWLGD